MQGPRYLPSLAVAHVSCISVTSMWSSCLPCCSPLHTPTTSWGKRCVSEFKTLQQYSFFSPIGFTHNWLAVLWYFTPMCLLFPSNTVINKLLDIIYHYQTIIHANNLSCYTHANFFHAYLTMMKTLAGTRLWELEKLLDILREQHYICSCFTLLSLFYYYTASS